MKKFLPKDFMVPIEGSPWSLVVEWSFHEVHNANRENLGSHNNSTISNLWATDSRVSKAHTCHLSSMSVLNLTLHEFITIVLYQSNQMKAPFLLLLISSQTLPHLSLREGMTMPCHAMPSLDDSIGGEESSYHLQQYCHLPLTPISNDWGLMWIESHLPR